ncbi:MAG: hypothetical protein ABIZ57_06695 [Candidatus Limnocylindria bacterium]
MSDVLLVGEGASQHAFSMYHPAAALHHASTSRCAGTRCGADNVEQMTLI